MTVYPELILEVRVIPRAARSQIAGVRDSALLVRLNAPPVDGAANEALITLIAQALDIPRRHVSIVSGASSRTKRLRVKGCSAADVEKLYR